MPRLAHHFVDRAPGTPSTRRSNYESVAAMASPPSNHTAPMASRPSNHTPPPPRPLITQRTNAGPRRRRPHEISRPLRFVRIDPRRVDGRRRRAPTSARPSGAGGARRAAGRPGSAARASRRASGSLPPGCSSRLRPPAGWRRPLDATGRCWLAATSEPRLLHAPPHLRGIQQWLAWACMSADVGSRDPTAALHGRRRQARTAAALC